MQCKKIGISLFTGLLIIFPLALNPMIPVFSALTVPNTLVRIKSSKVQADQLLQQGMAHYQDAKFADAIAFWQQALTIYQKLQDRQGEAAALGNLGAAYLALGDNQQAIAISQQLLTIAREIRDRRSEAVALANLAIAYKVQGNYNQAIQSHRQALAMMEEIGDRPSQVQILNNLANSYEALGNYEEAIRLQNQNLNLARELKNRQGEGVVLGNLGALYARLGERGKAIEFHQQSLVVAQSIGDRQGEGYARQNLGSVYHSLGKIEEATNYYQQSLKIAQEISDRWMQLNVLGNLGLVYAEQGDVARAIDYHQNSIKIAQTINAPQEQALALNNLAHTLLEADQLIEAEKQLRAAIQLLDSLRTELDDAAQVSLFDTQVLTYNLLQQVLIAQNRPEAALEASGHGRSRAFISLLAKRLAIDTKVTDLERPLTIDRIKQIARNRNATLVEYSIIPEDFLAQGKMRGLGKELFIWVVRPTGQVAFRRVNLKPLLQSGISLKDLVINSRNAIGVRGRGGVAVELIDEPNETERLKRLHQLLIKPIADLLPKDVAYHVIFVPQDSLFLVPFPALVDDSGKYLIEKHTILTAPAIQVLDLTRQQRQRLQTSSTSIRKEITSTLKTQNSLVVGNPTMPKVAPLPGEPPQPLPSLPGAEAEALAIAQILQTSALTGNQATKAAVLQQLPQAKIVHLATHGLLEDFGDSVPGAIALAPSGNDNGLLTAGEILQLRLNAKLVVLSACDTGRGEITGDGIVGLSRSLIAAGVPSAIVSLWAIPDAPTAFLMTEFYRNWQQTPDKAAALRKAMLATMKRHPNPRNWAAFTLIGEAR